ncbi:hypothetical protein DENSPDRAFT_621966 [Dentipellis sp. KUC8613]|nr:hypothetical protein DENSPDRAFT_621966 [Dentipellis sp. KUC8613]
MALPLDQAVLAAILVESIVYGVCVTMSLVTILVFLRVGASNGLANKRLLFMLVVMLTVATAHLGLSFARIFEGFIHHSADASAYFANLGHPLFIAKNSVLVIQTVLGDGVNIWRCYVVNGKNIWVIVFPIVVLIGGFIAGIFVLVTLAANASSTIFGVPSKYITAYDTLMMATSVYCTVAIAWRIWSSGKFTTSFDNLLHVLVVIVETGALHTSTLFAFLVTYLAGSNGQYVAVDMITPLVPSIFCLLILQVKFHQFSDFLHERSSGGQQQTVNGGRTSRSGIRRMWGFRREPNNIAVSAFQLQPVAIQISTHAEEHYPGEDSSRLKRDLSDDIEAGMTESK